MSSENSAKDYEYPREELEGALRRAFVVNRASVITIDGHVLARERFLKSSWEFGMENGWLEFDQRVSEDDYFDTVHRLSMIGRGEKPEEEVDYSGGLGQYTALNYRLTAEGKKHFGLTA